MNQIKRTTTRRKAKRPIKRKYHTRTVQGRKLNKKKVAITIAIFLLLIASIVKTMTKDKTIETSTGDNITATNATDGVTNNQIEDEPSILIKREITDWNLRLANYENILPKDFTVEVANIDENKQFDARALPYLKQMINDMLKDGIKDIWVQSAYRSIERQKELYDNSIKKYLKQGKTQEEAEKLTDEYINKPGSSDHNLGLAVDFNYVNDEFEDTKAFKWLKEYAEDYGFVLRYPADKEETTRIAYESWHWRYVGEEHAKKMNELNMCLEEYIEYLENGGTL